MEHKRGSFVRRPFFAASSKNEESLRFIALSYRLGVVQAVAVTLVVPCLMLLLRADPEGLNFAQPADIVLMIASLAIGPFLYVVTVLYYNIRLNRRCLAMLAAQESVSDEVLQAVLYRMIRRARWLHSFLCRRHNTDLTSLMKALLPGDQTRRISFWAAIKWDAALFGRWFGAMRGPRGE
jgi:hypothetical protein